MNDYKVPTAAEVKKRWQAGVDDMLHLRRNYQLNESFVHGEQWLVYNDTTFEVQQLEFRNVDDAKYRATVNKMGPRTIQFEARMVRTPLQFEPRPEGIDPEDLRRARIAQQILVVESHRRNWEDIRAQEVHLAMLGGVSAVSVEPDWEWELVPAARMASFPMPEAQPDMDGADTGGEPIPDVFTGEYIKMPKRPSTKLDALSAVEFCLEPGSRSEQDARWWIRCTTLTPAQAKERYKLDKEPSPDSAAFTSVMHRSLLTSKRSDRQAKAVLVYVMYERPCDSSPGCVLHVVGDKVVLEAEWPFPFTDRLNLKTFVQRRMAGTWKGDTILNDARQLQVNYNRAYTTINAHLGKADNARMIVPAGAIMDGDDEFTGEVAEIIRINPDSQFPQWMQAPQIPRWLREHLVNLENEMDDLYSAHAVSRGQAPGDRNSGLALSILAEKDETPLGLMAADQQRGWQTVAEMVLRLNKHLLDKAAQHPEQPLDITVEDVMMGEGGVPQQVIWSAADLPKHPVVHVPLESVMPRSQAAVQDAMIRLAQTFPQMFQQFGPSQLAVMLQAPEPSLFTQVADPQVALAQWENGRMTVGADDTEVEIADWHDHDKHVQEHNKLRASAAYRNADPAIRQYIDLHITAHARLAQQQMQAQQMQQMQQQIVQQQQPQPAMAGQQPTEGQPQ